MTTHEVLYVVMYGMQYACSTYKVLHLVYGICMQYMVYDVYGAGYIVYGVYGVCLHKDVLL